MVRFIALSLLCIFGVFSLSGCEGEVAVDTGADTGDEDIVEADPCEGLVCDDGNLCTVGHCEFGDCIQEADLGRVCDDGNACTTEDTCSAEGVCTGSGNLICDDENACTNDACDELEGCTVEEVGDGSPCNDGDACTTADSCEAGVCAGIDKECPDDGNSCTVPAGCDTKDGECLVTEVSDGSICADGDDCTVGDYCEAGECISTGPAECEDNNACTENNCNPKGGCWFKPTTDLCDDGSLCTSNDQCDFSANCTGEALKCDDGNPCTNDTCNPTSGCVATPVDMPCEDGNLCTVNDGCKEGICTAGIQKTCADSNECTTEFCELDTGNCNVSYNDKACDDGSLCTVDDVCLNGFCDGANTDCNDGNVCTADSCSPDVGCTYAVVTKPCDDGNICTIDDLCAEKACAGTLIPCDDGKVCTTDSCDPDTGCVHEDNAVVCDDGNLCTLGDVCAGGACAGEAPLECDDGNVCTNEICESDVGCTFPSNDAACEDGNACTLADTCANSACEPGAGVPNCDDGNLCTTDSCDPSAGCVHVANDLACDDDDPCTLGDACAGKACTAGGGTPNCDDGNVCTEDACVAGAGCANTPGVGNCEDGNPCTEADTCVEGACTAGNNVCACQNDSDCGAQEDGDLCNGTLFCDQSAVPFTCEVDLSTVIVCDDSGNTECLEAQCAASTGECAAVPVNEASACADGDLCTPLDQCEGGECVPGPQKSCDDGNLCTTDACEVATGDCTNAANVLPCSDSSACTFFDGCVDGSCVGTLLNCNDGNPCTADSCDVIDGCVNVPISSVACDDDNACTTGDICQFGECAGADTSILDCNDENPCTTDACDSLSGCLNVPNVLACEDGNACSIEDQCIGGNCIGGPPLECNDGNVCTVNTCDADSGCTTVPGPTTTACSDGDLCSTGDACVNTFCEGTGDLVCDDDNPCTTDGCDPLTGCTFVSNSAPCSDGDACTVGDLCGGAICVSGDVTICSDGEVCTDDSCDSGSGDCVSTPNTQPCTDNNACTVGDHCGDSGTCESDPLDCVDGNVCTTDSCDVALGCKNAPISGLVCDDGNPCTTGDFCQNGKCTGDDTSGVDCDDKNVCTDDACNLDGGCVYFDNEALCDDGSLCTANDKCFKSVCTGGQGPSCNDGNPCTDDSCEALSGCLNKDNSDACEDGNACSIEDQCQKGACQGGTALSCDDKNACTSDSCSPEKGCQHVDISASCDDGVACTVDSCDPGKGCSILPDNSACDLGGLCTNYICQPVSGCEQFMDDNCCGNGLVESGNDEECDDFNAVAGDGCSAGCFFEVPGGCTTHTLGNSDYVFCHSGNGSVGGLHHDPAVSTCAGWGGTLAIINDAFEQEWIEEIAVAEKWSGNAGGINAWIGLTGTSDGWAWDDGTLLLDFDGNQFGYTNWADLFPLSPSSKPCVFMDAQGLIGQWANSSCGIARGYICEKDNDAAPWVCGDGTLDPNEECDDANALDGDGCSAKCGIETGPGGLPLECDFLDNGESEYAFCGVTGFTHEQSQALCEGWGGDLVSLNDSVENDWIMQMVAQFGWSTSEIWGVAVGLTLESGDPVGGVWVWEDSTLQQAGNKTYNTHKNWNQVAGMPQDAPGFSLNCAYLTHTQEAGLNGTWLNEECSDLFWAAHSGFVCEKKTASETLAPECVTSALNGSVYAFCNLPDLDYNNSAANCESWGGDLVSFNAIEENQWVAEAIVDLEWKVPGGFGFKTWVGLFLKSGDPEKGTWLWEDGTTQQSGGVTQNTFKNWAAFAGMPGGDSGQGCGYMFSQEDQLLGQWGNSACTASEMSGGNLGHVCEKKGGAPGSWAPVCGDGDLGAGEECDDGNTSDGDGCSSKCTEETSEGIYEPKHTGKGGDGMRWALPFFKEIDCEEHIIQKVGSVEECGAHCVNYDKFKCAGFLYSENKTQDEVPFQFQACTLLDVLQSVQTGITDVDSYLVIP